MLRRFGQPPPPNALPPDQVRIVDLKAEPWPDGKRIRILIEITPFQEFPNLDVLIQDEDFLELARTSVIETAEEKLLFTMHLPANMQQNLILNLIAILGYPDQPEIDRRQIQFELPK